MSTVKEITTMCKAGQLNEAYELACADFEKGPSNVWVQREVGWALYYLIRKDAEGGDYENLTTHLDEFLSLDQLTIANDSVVYDMVLFWIGYIAKKHFNPSSPDTPVRLTSLFSRLKSYSFSPSKGYSMLIEGFCRFTAWDELLDFIDWWGLDNLMDEDYRKVEISTGQKIISVAERVYISVSKGLLRKNDRGKIESFLPRLEWLEEHHPQMTYPGYFHGKLLLALGRSQEESLKVTISFARRKSSEFWIWQLLSEVFADEADKHLSCLLRAVNCHTQEKYLGKVRMKLADFYTRRGELALAKYQIDVVTRTYLTEGWSLPHEVDYWIHQPWINTVKGIDKAPIDYMAITNDILLEGSAEAIAVVSFFDNKSKKAHIIYGHKQQTSQKLCLRVNQGDVLKINYTSEANGQVRVVSASKSHLPSDLSYAKVVEGKVVKKMGLTHAFLKFNSGSAFISPQITERHQCSNGATLECLIVYDYNRKKDQWSWKVAKIIE